MWSCEKLIRTNVVKIPGVMKAKILAINIYNALNSIVFIYAANISTTYNCT